MQREHSPRGPPMALPGSTLHSASVRASSPVECAKAGVTCAIVVARQHRKAAMTLGFMEEHIPPRGKSSEADPFYVPARAVPQGDAALRTRAAIDELRSRLN